jgi:hypothetical protein
MSLTIELPEALEARLREEAGRRGLDTADLARQLIEQLLPEPAVQYGYLQRTLTPEEWIRQTREWSESHRDWPVLPPEAYERASFYEDHD